MRQGWRVFGMTIVLVVAAGILIITLWDLLGKNFFPHYDKSLQNLHNAFLVLLTLALVCVAWYQLSEISKSARADFLLRIDDRYGKKPITDARIIIQRLYRESHHYNPDAISEDIHRLHIAKRIDEISKDIEMAEEYSSLLNLLDFLETISYFANHNHIRDQEIEELMGGSLIFFYCIFEPRIKERRRKYDNPGYYAEFELLIKKLKIKQLKRI